MPGYGGGRVPGYGEGDRMPQVGGYPGMPFGCVCVCVCVCVTPPPPSHLPPFLQYFVLASLLCVSVVGFRLWIEGLCRGTGREAECPRREAIRECPAGVCMCGCELLVGFSRSASFLRDSRVFERFHAHFPSAAASLWRFISEGRHLLRTPATYTNMHATPPPPHTHTHTSTFSRPIEGAC